jgi:hypothetical protein
VATVTQAGIPRTPIRSELPSQARTTRVSSALPLLVICRQSGDGDLLQPLRDDGRLELFVADALTPTWVSFAHRVAVGLLIVAIDDPLGALVYARTVGIDGLVLLATHARHRGQCAELEAITGTMCVLLPFTDASRNRIARQLSVEPGAAIVEPTLRLLLDPIARIVRYRDQNMALSQREFALLHCLAQHGGRPVRAEHIMSYVWERTGPDCSRQILDVYVSQLRRKLERIGLHGPIRTFRGFGYALETKGPFAR